MRDSSIVPPNYDRKDCEFVSPVLKGVQGLQHLIKVVEIIRAPLGETVTVDGVEYAGLGGRVNRSCGIHIHVGYDVNRPLSDMQKLINLVGGFEAGLYASTGTKARERNNYSVPIKAQFDTTSAPSPQRLQDQRYLSLNLQNILTGRRPTVEFRLFAGSLNGNKIATYVMMSLGMVQQALSMPKAARWNGKEAGATFGATDKGQGYREVNRLVRRLGWTRGAAWYGECGRLEGTGIPTMKKSIELLKALADKYDRSE
jgi:hypothetical protein